jgi:hypothetical protein
MKLPLAMPGNIHKFLKNYSATRAVGLALASPGLNNVHEQRRDTVSFCYEI